MIKIAIDKFSFRCSCNPYKNVALSMCRVKNVWIHGFVAETLLLETALDTEKRNVMMHMHHVFDVI